MDRQDLVTGFSAGAQDPPKDFLLTSHGGKMPWAGVEPDFADVSSLAEQILPEIDLSPVLGYQLRMQPKGRSHVFGVRCEYPVARPSLGRGRHRQREYFQPFAFPDERFEVGIQVEVAVEIDEPHAVISASAAGENVSTSRSSSPTSLMPRR